jgi:hypothetical protein
VRPTRLLVPLLVSFIASLAACGNSRSLEVASSEPETVRFAPPAFPTPEDPPLPDAGPSPVPDAPPFDDPSYPVQCVVPALPATAAPAIATFGAAPPRLWDGLYHAGTYVAHEMRVFSTLDSETGPVEGVGYRGAIHFDGKRLVTFAADDMGVVAVATYRIDTNKTSMTLEPTCGAGPTTKMDYRFAYQLVTDETGARWDEVEWPAFESADYTVYVAYRKPH